MPMKPYFSKVSDFIDLLKAQDFEYCQSPASDAPVVSIISSFYNVPRDYFIETNRSIRNQTFQNYEWIIADDCSTDAAAEALFDELPELNSKIKTVRRAENGGLAAGRNTAIAQASGKYLFFMDTDDLLEPTMIEKCVLFLETHADFSFVNTYSVGFGEQEYWWDKGFDQPSEFINENRVTGRLLYRKEDFDTVGGFDESLRFYEDWERWLNAIAHGQKGWTIPEYLDCYRRTASGLLATSRSKVEKETEVTRQIQARYQQFFDDNELPDVVVERPMFDLSALRRRLTIQNPISTASEGKRLLCWFPHLEIGGADKFNLDLLAGLKRRGYAITIVTTVPAPLHWFEQIYELTPDIFHLPGLLHYGHWLTFAQYIIESRQVDVCFISNAYYAYYLLPSLRQDFPGVAFVDYTHTEDPGWREGGYPRVSCQFSEFLDRHIVTSNALASKFIEMNKATASKIKVCYINVDEQFWQADEENRRRVRREMEVADDGLVVLFPARMTGQKRPLFFIEIINQLVMQEFAVTAVMLGGGELVEAVTERVAEYGLLAERIRVLPFVSSSEMVGYYSAADVVLLPSAYEGISLVMYEAMAMGLPVVASDVGGQRELLTPETGVLVSLGEGDESECDRYVEILRPLLQSEKRKYELGQAARRRIKSFFRLEMMVERMEVFFGEARRHRERRRDIVTSGFVGEEMLLWVQEFLALDVSWQESQQLQAKLIETNQWAVQLERERNIYRTQGEAWRHVAQKNQLALNRSTVAHNTVNGGLANGC